MQTYRFFIELSFRGTSYHGWQRQDNAHSVQEELDEALSLYYRQVIRTKGAGRTDTGVHALQYFAQFDIVPKKNGEAIFPATKDIFHLNCMLSQNISIKRIFRVNDDASARFDAKSRTYEYRIYQSKNPFLVDTAFYYPQELDFTLLENASKIILGVHDFSCFSKSRVSVKTRICRIDFAEWRKEEGMFIFVIKANRFLRNMVRALVGTLLDVGSGKISSEQFREIIQSKNRAEAGVSVDGCGLYLTNIEYNFDEITSHLTEEKSKQVSY